MVGRSTVGSEKAKFSDAFWITALGIILGTVINAIIPVLGFIISFIVWLALVRHFFDTGWLGALGISIVAVILLVVVTFIFATFFGLPISVMPKPKI